MAEARALQAPAVDDSHRKQEQTKAKRQRKWKLNYNYYEIKLKIRICHWLKQKFVNKISVLIKVRLNMNTFLFLIIKNK